MDARVKARIASKKVMVFSKASCPFCTRLKLMFRHKILNQPGKKSGQTGGLSPDDYDVWELDLDRDGIAAQVAVGKISHVHTVPQVFVNGKYFGGSTDTIAKIDKLKKALGLEKEPDQHIRQHRHVNSCQTTVTVKKHYS